MGNTLYTATGCARCQITKRFMAQHEIAFEEFDIKADGKEAFARFYRANRDVIFRDQDGVEFPVFSDGSVVRQGVGVVIGHLIAGQGLDGFIGRSRLHGEWIDGFDVSAGDADRADDFMQVLFHLKRNGLKTQISGDGRNASVLEKIVAEGLGDRMLMEIRGPAGLYAGLSNHSLDEQELARSMGLTVRFPEYQFYTVIGPCRRGDGTVSYLTPEEIGQAAHMIETATSSKKHPYELRRFDADQASDEAFKAVEELPPSAMFKYRTAARRYMVMTELAK